MNKRTRCFLVGSFGIISVKLRRDLGFGYLIHLFLDKVRTKALGYTLMKKGMFKNHQIAQLKTLSLSCVKQKNKVML